MGDNSDWLENCIVSIARNESVKIGVQFGEVLLSEHRHEDHKALV